MYYYTYKITNIESNMMYIGSRGSKIEPVLDIGIEYFSSSKNSMFLSDQINYPEKFKYEVIEIFKTRQDAFDSELELLNKLDVRKSEKYYNGRFKEIPELELLDGNAIIDSVECVGKLIKLARHEKKVSQEILAVKTNLSRGTINRIENGDITASIVNVFKCCFVLDIPVFGGDAQDINNLSKLISHMNSILPHP